MAIAYGVAMNKLNLHVPSTCPQDWRGLMEGWTEILLSTISIILNLSSLALIDCWRFDSHERPNFQTIIDRLDEIAHSNLPNIPDEFHEMQNHWRLEIGDRMEEIRVKEYVSLIHFIFRV